MDFAKSFITGAPLLLLSLSIIALVVLGGIWTMSGIAVTTTTVASVNECVDIKEMGQTAATECTNDMPVAPANEAGLRPGDTITSINGTQVSTALALAGLFGAHRCLQTALVTGALSTDAVRARMTELGADRVLDLDEAGSAAYVAAEVARWEPIMRGRR